MRLLLALLLVLAIPAMAADPAPSVEVTGAVSSSGPVALASLTKKTVNVTQVTGQGEFKGSFTGPTLWDALGQAKVIDPGKGALLQRTVTVTARDGYAVVLSYSEINPDYGNNEAIIAETSEGLRLVLPKDRRAGRAVRDVVKIEVK